MDWQERFYEFIAEWLRFKGLPCVKVICVEHESEEWWDYSDAHGYSISCRIQWIDENGNNQSEFFNDPLEDLFWRK